MSERYKSITQMSEMTGIDRRTLKQRLATLKVQSVEGKAQLYDMFEAFKYLDGGPVAGSQAKLEKQMKIEQLRLETAKADKVELEVGERRLQLVSIEDVASVVEREYGAVRAGILSMPSKVAQDLVLMDEFLVIKNYLEDAINDILTELTADSSYANKNAPEAPSPASSDEALPNVNSPNEQAPSEPTEDPSAEAAPEPS